MKSAHKASFSIWLFCGVISIPAAAETPFEFESVVTLEDMYSFLRSRFAVGASRADVRRVFVEEGHATLKIKAGDIRVEKYIYDIDLCHYYVWRWNISADYDENGYLRQAYVNGNTVYANGTPKPVISTVALPGKKASLYKVQRPRPEAYKGESSLAFLLLDRDSDPKTTDDQLLVGTGPSRADPANMGRMIAYSEVDPWRSIFDFDQADHIVPYKGSCDAAEKAYGARPAVQGR